MTGDVTPYTGRITSLHANKPNFVATVAISCQPFADIIALAEAVPSLYDIDNAVGEQLDVVGQWIGISRQLSEPLVGVYFTLGSTGPGLGSGILRGPYDPLTGLVSLNDTDYRTLLYARIADNQWDGTIPGAYAILEQVFPQFTVVIQDYGDDSISIGLVGNAPLSATQSALFTDGLLTIQPAGVWVRGYVLPPANGAPIFGLGANNSTIGGLGSGALSRAVGGN